MMLAAGGAEMHGVACGRDLFERPHLGVELRRLMQIAHAKLDAADARHRAVRHGNRPLVIAWPEFRTVGHPEPACCGPIVPQRWSSLGITSVENSASERSASARDIAPRNIYVSR